MGHVRLGTINTIGISLLLPIIMAFCKEYPNIKLTFELNNSENITLIQISGNKLFSHLGNIICICPV
ncbi:LysR substrate-binding domain-containing protein [Lacrimispora sp.]|uniref:LysR substrate-binding domain-containing protein n=1 Tax=Lacrimispora sp. TaxID=2719234 RepID=UPI003FA56C7C